MTIKIVIYFGGYVCITFGTTRRKEGNVLFNDALNIFYLRLYGVSHMVNDHSHSERGNPLPLHGLLFPTSELLDSLQSASFVTRRDIPYFDTHLPATSVFTSSVRLDVIWREHIK